VDLDKKEWELRTSVDRANAAGVFIGVR